jgi:hypothetical protein
MLSIKAGTVVQIDENRFLNTKGTFGVVVNVEEIVQARGKFNLMLMFALNGNSIYLEGDEKITPVAYNAEFDRSWKDMRDLRKMLDANPSMIDPQPELI